MREWRAKGVLFVVCFLFIVGMFTVGIFTVALALFVLRGPSPLLRRGSDVCPVLVSYFNINCWMYFGHTFLDFGYLWDSMFAQFSIILASFFRASIFNRCWEGFYIIFDVFFDTFSVRTRNLLNLQKTLFLQ